jgi:hypothetical protein
MTRGIVGTKDACCVAAQTISDCSSFCRVIPSPSILGSKVSLFSSTCSLSRRVAVHNPVLRGLCRIWSGEPFK